MSEYNYAEDIERFEQKNGRLKYTPKVLKEDFKFSNVA